MQLNTEQLLSFVSLVQTGSITAAAQLRHLTQPAISNQLKRLQDSIGLPLYRRQGRGLVLTGAGEAFYRYALDVQQSLYEAEAFADALHGFEAGRVYLVASQTIAGSLLPAALVAFRELAPRIEIFIDSSNSRQVFEQIGEHDLGLVESPLPASVPDCCKVVPLGYDRIVAVMRNDHALTACQKVTLEQLATYPLVWRESGSGTREVLEQAFMAEGTQHPEIRLCIGGVAAMLEAVRQGLGIGVVSQFCLPTGEHLLSMRPLQPSLQRPMSLLVPAHASPVAKKFANFLVPYLQARLSQE